MADQPLLNTFGRQPLAIERGDGIWLYDVKGERYLDTFAAHGTCGLGHAHGAVSEALAHQSRELTQCSPLFHQSLEHTLARRLCDLTDMAGAILAPSAAEANEAAIRIARQYGHQRGIAAPAIIVMEGAYHGPTLATVSASGSRKLQAGAEPLLSGFVRVPFNDLSAIEQAAANNSNIVAVLAETIQGEAGLIPAQAPYLQALRRLCDQHQLLLMLDETLTGNGRTGAFLACQRHQVVPDVVTLAHGLANGIPLGACLARGPAAEGGRKAIPGPAFSANPLACAAALAVLRTLEQDHLMARARALGNRILTRLRDQLEGASYIRDLRGLGLAVAVEMAEPCPELVMLARTQGLLINVTAERAIRLLPPLTMTDAEADTMTDRLIQLIKLYAADERERPRR